MRRPKTDTQQPASHAGAPPEQHSPVAERAAPARDLVALVFGFAALILFVATAGRVMPAVVRSLQGVGLPPDRVLSAALLLNIALILFGLQRHRELTDELDARRAAEAQARKLADRDPMTGCMNRPAITTAADRLLNLAHDRGERVGFIMIDIDNFKRINDAHGHGAGNAALQACAQRITDLLPIRGMLARLGGDEFACVIPADAHGARAVEELAQRIIREVAAPIMLGRTEVMVTLSIGLACSDPRAPAGRQDAEALLHMADIAMYHAKHSGKNRACWFEPALEQEARQRSDLEVAIRSAVAQGRFVPFYQPLIDLASGRITGFEMLARWNDAAYATIGPEVFVPIAEGAGLIDALSEGLIRQALQDARDWDPALKLAVNISPVQLRDPWFAQKLLKLLVEANVSPSRFEIEITETSLHQNIPQVRAMLTSLKNQGVCISLDDFGAGYSSLAQLQSLPFDRLKIDRAFVMPMTGCEDSATIVRAIASLGEGLGLPITAEGVESSEVAARLQDLGKLQAQGYLYGRPECAAVTRERLAGLGLLARPDSLPAAQAPDRRHSNVA